MLVCRLKNLIEESKYQITPTEQCIESIYKPRSNKLRYDKENWYNLITWNLEFLRRSYNDYKISIVLGSLNLKNCP